jgi:parallel beta-helix repeat protein
MRSSNLLLLIFLAAVFPSSPLGAQQNPSQARYWAVNGSTKPIPYAAPSYICRTDYFVAPNGNDANSGSAAAPWQTLSHAISVLSNGKAEGGVCVNAAPGTYIESVRLSELNGSSDSPAGYLVFRSSMLHGATLQEPYTSVGTYKSTVDIENSHFVIFDGFNVIGYPSIPFAGEHGFYAINSHHIRFLNNIVHDVGGGGIVTAYSDYVEVRGNVIHGTSCCNRFGANSISDWEPVAIDTRPGFHNVFSGNIIFGNSEGPDGKFPHTEGHGIIIDRAREGPSGSYPAATLVENNLIYNNGGAGIAVFISNNVVVRNNTVFNNGRDPLGGYVGGEICVLNSSYAVVVNNIAVANPTTNPNLIAIHDQTWDHTNIGNVWANNLTFNGSPGDPSAGRYAEYGLGTPITAAKGNILGADPLFVNAPAAGFALQPLSPAVGKGTSAYGVPSVDLSGNRRSSTIDIGAFAFHIIPPL